jgi:hypothetical protein
MEKTEEKVLESKMVVESKMVQLSNILVGTDFSPASDRALEYALSLARRYEARIFLTHVITSDTNVMVAPQIMARTFDGCSWRRGTDWRNPSIWPAPRRVA